MFLFLFNFWIHPNKAICINAEIFSLKGKKYYTDRNVSFLFNIHL